MLENRSKSQDSDFALVSNEDMNEILPSSCWTLGQVAWTKMAKNPPHLWHHPQKIYAANQIFFFP